MYAAEIERGRVSVILWPCVVSFEDGHQVSPVKVFTLGDGRCEVWAWNGERNQAEVVADGELTVLDQAHSYLLGMNAGTARIVVDPKSCGCSHPLKHFRPANAVPTRDERTTIL